LSLSAAYSQSEVIEDYHYLFPEFTQGVVLMKSGTKNNALLNYNLLTEEIVFEDKGKKFSLGKEEQELVDTVFIKNRKFFKLNNTFIEFIYHSKFDLYAEHKCSVKQPGKPAGYGGTSETSAITSYSSYLSGGLVYELKLPNGYETKPYNYYWLKKNGGLNKFMNMRQLMKLYDDKEDLFKAYIKKNEVIFNNQESMVQLIKYLETN
jgi:hypothetical protein